MGSERPGSPHPDPAHALRWSGGQPSQANRTATPGSQAESGTPRRRRLLSRGRIIVRDADVAGISRGQQFLEQGKSLALPSPAAPHRATSYGHEPLGHLGCS